ncbi:hypothetical protein C2E23DRAFT_234757 [Lenzites betulinus]|nr:hypothetical protein C2E23DRAFT_234757 [Lenzites betulinus]
MGETITPAERKGTERTSWVVHTPGTLTLVPLPPLQQHYDLHFLKIVSPSTRSRDFLVLASRFCRCVACFSPRRCRTLFPFRSSPFPSATSRTTHDPVADFRVTRTLRPSSARNHICPSRRPRDQVTLYPPRVCWDQLPHQEQGTKSAPCVGASQLAAWIQRARVVPTCLYPRALDPMSSAHGLYVIAAYSGLPRGAVIGSVYDTWYHSVDLCVCICLSLVVYLMSGAHGFLVSIVGGLSSVRSLAQPRATIYTRLYPSLLSTLLYPLLHAIAVEAYDSHEHRLVQQCIFY